MRHYLEFAEAITAAEKLLSMKSLSGPERSLLCKSLIQGLPPGIAGTAKDQIRKFCATEIERIANDLSKEVATSGSRGSSKGSGQTRKSTRSKRK